jgi:hypothetical protein
VAGNARHKGAALAYGSGVILAARILAAGILAARILANCKSRRRADTI